MPGGDGSAPLAYKTPNTYRDGVYRFLDADGNVAEVSIEWCQLQINADGLKLAIILPVGLAAAIALGFMCVQCAEKRAARKRLLAFDEEERRRKLAAHRELESADAPAGQGKVVVVDMDVPLANA